MESDTTGTAPTLGVDVKRCRRKELKRAATFCSETTGSGGALMGAAAWNTAGLGGGEHVQSNSGGPGTRMGVASEERGRAGGLAAPSGPSLGLWLAAPVLRLPLTMRWRKAHCVSSSGTSTSPMSTDTVAGPTVPVARRCFCLLFNGTLTLSCGRFEWGVDH